MVAPYSWMVAGEAPSQRLRSYTFGVASACGYLLAWLVTFTTPYFINPSALNWGPRYGYIWFPSCIVAALWAFFFLPEFKGRTLEEINTMVRTETFSGTLGILYYLTYTLSSSNDCRQESSGATKLQGSVNPRLLTL